jgi:hypothetical protein
MDCTFPVPSFVKTLMLECQLKKELFLYLSCFEMASLGFGFVRYIAVYRIRKLKVARAGFHFECMVHL